MVDYPKNILSGPHATEVFGRTEVAMPRLFLLAMCSCIWLAGTPAAADRPDDGPVAIVQALQEAADGNDADAVRGLVAPDVVWRVHGPDHLMPYAGTFNGPAGVAEYLARVHMVKEIIEVDYGRPLVNGNVVTVLGLERGVGRQTGGAYQSTRMQVVTVRHGAVSRFEEIFDSAAISEALAPADPERGKAYYTTCAACHGVTGAGNPNMHAPNLTIQDGDYLVRQMRNFRQHVRGGVADFYGWQMNGRANALSGDRAVRDVVAFIRTLPDSTAKKTIDGDVSRGEIVYSEQCASCHGEAGEGIAALAAPRLSGVQDWYHLEQLLKYRSGIRGTDERDPLGQQMRQYAVDLESEDDLRAIVAYIAQLSESPGRDADSRGMLD